MLLEKLPVVACGQCDASTKAYLKKNIGIFSRVFNYWNPKSEEYVRSMQIYQRFHNQQRHFIHFKKFKSTLHYMRSLFRERSHFCVDHIIKHFDSLEEGNQSLSQNCMDFLMVAVNHWEISIDRIQSSAMGCWKYTEMQMSTGHFVKLAAIILGVLSRVLVLSEFSKQCAVELYNSLRVIRSKLPVMGVPIPYLVGYPDKMQYICKIQLNQRCTEFLRLEGLDDYSIVTAAFPSANLSNSSCSSEKAVFNTPSLHGPSTSSAKPVSSVDGVFKRPTVPLKKTPRKDKQGNKTPQQRRQELFEILQSARNKSSKSNFLDFLFK